MYDYGNMISSGGVSLCSWHGRQVCSLCDDPYLVYYIRLWDPLPRATYNILHYVMLCKSVQPVCRGVSGLSSLYHIQVWVQYVLVSLVYVIVSLPFLSVSVHLCCVYVSRYSCDSCLVIGCIIYWWIKHFYELQQLPLGSINACSMCGVIPAPRIQIISSQALSLAIASSLSTVIKLYLLHCYNELENGAVMALNSSHTPLSLFDCVDDDPYQSWYVSTTWHLSMRYM